MSKPVKIPNNASKSRGKRALLDEYLEKMVTIITNDGRNIIGTLKGYDQVCNVILAKSCEKVIDPKQPPEIIPLGLDVIRGDNIAVIGMLDDDNFDPARSDQQKGHPVKPVVH